jgi:hypothetical protein
MVAARPTRHPLARLALMVALSTTVACGRSGTDVAGVRASGGPAGDAYTVQVENAGTATLQAVSIVAGEDAPPIDVATLAGGQRTAEHRIGVLHENPVVSATVAGQRRTYQPVEGFSGFNPRLEPGRYVITLRWNAETEFLETTVTAAR